MNTSLDKFVTKNKMGSKKHMLSLLTRAVSNSAIGTVSNTTVVVILNKSLRGETRFLEVFSVEMFVSEDGESVGVLANKQEGDRSSADSWLHV